jgi:propionate CoA-transferase
MFGGIALGGLDFGCALYPCARTDQLTMFDMYHGGGLDVAVMGAAQIDETGNINVSQFNNRAVGCGGFIDITQSAKRVVFCSTLTVGDLETTFENGKVHIQQEGRHRKFVRRVGQITFNGKRALQSLQKVLLVTERCVFELTQSGWMIIEIAPGISIEKDILPQMDFVPLVSFSCGVMPMECF